MEHIFWTVFELQGEKNIDYISGLTMICSKLFSKNMMYFVDNNARY